MRKITAFIVLALFMLSLPSYAYRVEVGSNTGINLEINETAETNDDGTDDNETETDDNETDDNEDTTDDSQETDDTTDVSELETYAISRIKESDRTICEKRLNEAFPDASRDRIKNACEKHEKYILKLAGAKPVVAVSAATGLNRCVGFLQQNKSIDEAKDVCQKILRKEIVCVDYMAEMGIVNPVQKCEAVMKEAVSARTPIMASLKIEKFKLEERSIAREKLERAREKFEKAKERFDKAREVYEDKKEKFLEVRKKVKECKGSDTEECQKFNEEALQKAKDFLANAADKAIEHLNKIAEKVNSATGISEEEANKILADIDGAVSELEAAKAKAIAATTKQEVEDAAKEINSIWKRINKKAVLNAERIVHAKLGEIIQRTAHLEEKLQCSIDSVPEGADTSKLDSLVAEFSDHLDAARTKFEDAKVLFQKAREGDDSAMEQAKGLVRESQEELKKAHASLKDIVAEIKALGGKITSCPGEAAESEGESQ